MKIGIFRKKYHLNIGRKDTNVRRKGLNLGRKDVILGGRV